VIAQKDPRVGIWAMKSYKTPVAFHKEGYKVQGMSLKPPKEPTKSTEPKGKFYIEPITWSKANSKNRFQKFMKSQRITSTDKILAMKKLKLPGPSTYKPSHNFKVYNPPKITTPQLVMLDEAKF
jgi:hypothetical protein